MDTQLTGSQGFKSEGVILKSPELGKNQLYDKNAGLTDFT
jgi:hypothetical protein